MLVALVEVESNIKRVERNDYYLIRTIFSFRDSLAATSHPDSPVEEKMNEAASKEDAGGEENT